ncbi:MAG: HAMP domain-containing protein [Candidatus Aminicenantes bacterium]|nr:HAMP domain-containing protein [Candidatus Aminicenantes bacterium]
MISLTFILLLLVGSILFVIEKREVKTIFKDAQDRGILLAQNIANLNIESLKFWDVEGVKKNIEEKVNNELLYVVVYDRFNSPFVASDLVREEEDITCCSRLPEDATPESVHVRRASFWTNQKSTPIIEVEIPVFAAGSPTKWGSIKIGLSLEDMEADIRETRLMLILIGCGGLLLGMVGSAFLAKRITGPLKKLVDGTIRISKGDFSQTIDIRSQDEVGNLAQSFNRMTGELLHTRKRMEEANRKLIQAEKLASIGRISTTIAHEIRNPLTSVKLNIQKLLQEGKLDELEKEHLSISQEGVGQIEKFVKELLSFARVSNLHRERFSIDQIIDESLKTLSESLREKKISLEKTVVPNLPVVRIDADKMRQVFLNILRNACEAVDEGGKISLGLSSTQEDGDRKILVRISDDGIGIPEKDWENIFEPFFTTKSSGIGLGLANARKIVELHQGSIRVVKKRGQGTAFEVQIPCEEES